jgi:predicted lipoprotein with Yx(FWY)xxD motif
MSKTIWAIIVIIIIVVGGWFIYQSMSTPAAPVTTTDTTGSTTDTGTGVPSDNIYLAANDPAKGAYMTDFAGKTLYTFDNDNATPGQSSCTGACATAWPPYTSGATAQATLPTGISLITRADGSMQFAFNGKPLYYYAKDTAAGQLNGDGVGGTWHIVKM